MKTYRVYRYRNKIDGKCYIGQTCQSRVRREGRNMSGYKNSTKFWTAIQKYGIDAFEYEVLHNNLTLDDANRLESLEIERHDSLNNGYNCIKDGENREVSNESRKRMSNARKGKRHTDESKNRISENNARYWQNKQHSKETKQKIGDDNRKRIENGTHNFLNGKATNIRWAKYRERQRETIIIIAEFLYHQRLHKNKNWFNSPVESLDGYEQQSLF